MAEKIPKSRMVVRYEPTMNDEKPRTIVRAARTTRIPTSRNADWDSSPRAVAGHILVELAQDVDARGGAKGHQEGGDDVGDHRQGHLEKPEKPKDPDGAHEDRAEGDEDPADGPE